MRSASFDQLRLNTEDVLVARRTRAILPAASCIVTPSNHEPPVIVMHNACGFASRMIRQTDTIAAIAASRVPIAAINLSGFSLERMPTLRGVASIAREDGNGKSIPR